ncbi:Eukaryotic translation initiation factor 2A, partial [Perkinsus olseni]
AAAKAAKEEEEAEQRQKAEEEEKKVKEKAAAAAEREAHAEEGKQHTTDDKRLRNLRKKLKEVTALKTLPSGSLNDAQMAKIANESNLVEEIKEIEARLG